MQVQCHLAQMIPEQQSRTPANSVHHHSSCSTDPEPISCNQTKLQSSSPELQYAMQSVSSTIMFQLPVEDLKREQQHDSVLSMLLAGKLKVRNDPTGT